MHYWACILYLIALFLTSKKMSRCPCLAIKALLKPQYHAMCQISSRRTMHVNWGPLDILFQKRANEANQLDFETKNACHDEQHTDCGTLHYWGVGIHMLSGNSLLNITLHTQYCLIFPQRSIRYPITLKRPSEWNNIGVCGNLGFLDFKPGITPPQSTYLNIHGLKPPIRLFYSYILRNSGGIFIMIPIGG